MFSTQSVPCVYHTFGCVEYARHVAKSRSVTWFCLKYSWYYSFRKEKSSVIELKFVKWLQKF